jgi:hypothetical protein
VPALPTPATMGPGGLGGPVVGALRGGAIQTPLELDSGQLTVTPPQPEAIPSVSADQAECAALASINTNGLTVLQLAEMSGAALGYGLVSVSPHLIATPEIPGYLQGTSNENTNPTLPAPTAYQRRLAWVVVVKNALPSMGPCRSGSSTTTATGSSQQDYDYLVFLLDAKSGHGGLLYSGAYAQLCASSGDLPPSVSVPAERVSVPWTLGSRTRDGNTAQISATMLPCDGYPYTVFVDRTRPAATVIVDGPVNATCGPPKQVTFTLEADSAASALPAQIGHDRLGPYVTFPPP